MTTTQRRIALLTGASLATIGLASPAFAATVAGTAHVVGPAAVATDTLTICTTAGSTCSYGVSGVPSAIVNSAATGRLSQSGSGGDVELLMINLGNADIHALASDTAGAAATATAFASIDNAMSQVANNTGAAGTAINNFTNSATLLVDAKATATAGLNANASAYVDTALYQHAIAFAGGTASDNFVNSGAMTVSAAAVANAGAYADASAEVRTGVVQEVNGGLGSNLAANATNTGTLALKATATAVGTGASADAWAWNAVYQHVYGAGAATHAATAVANWHNGGTTGTGVVSLSAHAVGTATVGHATVSAGVGSAVDQYVLYADSATLNATNDGLVSLKAVATANGGT
jgi:hypothetical protein